MISDTAIIPLFPLEKVLFPGMVLPLHIFEERYKQMVADCLAESRGFGVLQRDDELPHRVGTMASSIKVMHTYDDGRMDILAQGRQRFVVDEFFYDRPYLTGRVEYVSDSDGPFAARASIEEMLTLYRAFIARLGLESDQKEMLSTLVDDIDEEQEISYIIGQTIGLDLAGQQRLLEATNPAERVNMLRGTLKLHQAVHQRARSLFEDEGFDPGSN